jgi:hypothetical protein
MKSILLTIIVFLLSVQISNAQWVRVSNGMGDLFVLGLGQNGNTIFAGTATNGAFISTDYGANWTQTPLNNQAVYSFTTNGANTFAGTNGNGVYVSADNGASWTQTPLNNRYVVALELIGGNVWAATNTYGIYTSADNGGSWTHNSLNNRDIYTFVVQGGNVFTGAGTNYGVYVSANNGGSWAQTTLNNRDVRSLVVNGGNIFAGTVGYGLYISTNNGGSWTPTSFSNTNCLSLQTIGNNIFAGSPPGAFFVSTDNGMTWTQRIEGLGNLQVYTIRIINNYIYAGTNGSGVWRRQLSELNGISQVSAQVPVHYSLQQNYPNPFNPNTKIRFALPKSAFAKLVVYDILGKEAATIVSQQLTAGTYEADWSAVSFPSGVYYYRITAGDYSETKKMVLVK